MLAKKRPQPCGYLEVTLMVPCEATEGHKMCGWCHDIYPSGKLTSRSQRKAEDYRTPLHGTHEVVIRSGAIVNEKGDRTKAAQALEARILEQCQPGTKPRKRTATFTGF